MKKTIHPFLSIHVIRSIVHEYVIRLFLLNGFGPVVVSSFLSLCFPVLLFSQVKNLSQPGFQWHEPTAWSPIGVPTALDSVIIGGETFIMPDSLARARYVYITAGGTLEIQRNVALNIGGRLLIRNSPFFGLENEGNLQIGGRLTVRNSASSAIINRSDITILNRAIVEVDSTSSGYGVYNTGDITSNGQIQVVKAKDHAVFSQSGTVVLQDSSLMYLEGYDTGFGKSGIYNRVSSTFTNDGTIDISNFYGMALLNEGQLTNEDTIYLHNNLGRGIANNGTLSNTHFIRVESNYDTAFINSGTFTNSAGATTFIDSTSDAPGIFNQSFFTNFGVLSVRKTYSDGIVNNASLVNESSGTLTVRNLQRDNGIMNLSGGTFLNRGSARVFDIHQYNGIVNEGLVDNYGDMEYENMYEDGITNNNQLINRSGAIIHTLNTGDYAIDGDPGSRFDNYGKIVLDSSNYGILVRGIFQNFDSVIFNVTQDYCFEVLDTFYNQVNGVVLFNDAGNNYALYSTELSENHGTLTIVANVSKGIDNDGDFLNTGTIHIMEASAYGIDNNTNALFMNEGNIHVENADVGVKNRNLFYNQDTLYILHTTGSSAIINQDTLYNQSGAYIEITNVLGVPGSGIHNGGTGASSIDLFENTGHIRIDGASGYGLRNDATGNVFLNTASGILEILNTGDTPLQIDDTSTFECSGILDIRD